MDRLARMLVISLMIGVAGFTMLGGFGRGSGLTFMLPLVVLGLGAVLLRRRGAVIERGWSGRASASPSTGASGPLAAVSQVAGPRPAATTRQVVAALARAEAREWRASPWFAAGVGFCVLMAVLFGVVWGTETDGAGLAWRGWFVLMPIMAFPMVGMAVVGSHQAVTRARRDGCDEMFAACPTDEATRTTGYLRASWVPAAAIAVFVVVSTGLLMMRNDLNYGPIDGRALADSLTGVALGVCGAWLGVALGRWAPWRLVPIVFVVALIPPITTLGGLGEPHWSNVRQLSPWPRYPDHDLLFTAPRVWWHLLWLVALGALMGVIAFVHARRDRRSFAAAVVVVVVALVAGIVQTRPLSVASAARLASLVAEPARHQTCRRAARLELCVYRGYEDYFAYALPNAVPVAAALPDTQPTVTFRQRFDGDVDVLGPEVKSALAGRPIDDPMALRLDFLSRRTAMVALRMRIAFAGTGLPVEASARGVPTVIAGQARGVVALWLAARGLDRGAAMKLADDHYNPDDDTPDRTPTALDLGMAWPEPCDVGPPPVAWSAQDLEAARRLLTQPADEVRALLHRDWARFTAPTTPTNELLAAAGIAPVRPAARVVAEPVVCPY